MSEQVVDALKKCPYCAELIQSDAKVCRYCKKELTKKQGGCDMLLAIILGVIVLWIAVFVLSNLGQNSSTTTSSSGDSIGAWVVCEKFVKDRLKSPASAEFPPNYSSYTKNLTDKKYEVSAYVDSQNSFGASLRTKFTCTVEYQPQTDKYKLIDLVFEEN